MRRARADERRALADDQIVVCARLEESERFRIPERLRQSNDPENEPWASRVRAYETVGQFGALSCSPVGSGGELGCTAQMIENAYREVNNLVASSPIFQIYHDGVQAVLRPYGLTFEAARPRLLEMYRTVLRHYVKGGELKGLDAEHVERLGELFGLSHELMAEVNAEELSKLEAGQ